MKSIPNTLKIILKILLSLAFFSVLLSFVRGNELLTVFTRISWPWFLVSFVITFVMLLASCAKWKLILDLKGHTLSFAELLKIYLIGYFFSNILPSTFGGDVVRSYYAGRIIENQSFAAVSVFVERFSGAFLLFILAGVAPFFQMELLGNPYLLVPACIGVSFAGMSIWLCLAKTPFAIPNRLAEGFFFYLRNLSNKKKITILITSLAFIENIYYNAFERLKKLKSEMQIALNAVKNNRPFVRRLIGLTLIFYVLTWVNVYSAFRAFHVDVSFLAICALVPAILLVAQLPVTLLGNLGYYESIYVVYFLLAGVEGAETLAMGLFLRLKMLVLGGVGCLVYFVYKQSHKLELEKQEKGG